MTRRAVVAGTGVAGVTRRAVVVGMGVAGLTCARLLADRSWVVQAWDLGDLADPPLVLNEVAGQLLRDPPTAVPQAGLVVDGAVLRRRLLERLAGDASRCGRSHRSSWPGRWPRSVPAPPWWKPPAAPLGWRSHPVRHGS